VGLWHPNLTGALGYPGAPEAYASLLERLGAMQPFVATLEQIVEWRRARRAAQASTVDAAGRPVWDRASSPAAAPPIEDASGEAMEWR
jgi:hypothetical protein